MFHTVPNVNKILTRLKFDLLNKKPNNQCEYLVLLVIQETKNNLLCAHSFFVFLHKKINHMAISVSKLNKFVLFKLPSAYICGVRVKAIDDNTCIVSVKHRWINQNPFNSMYFAVQAMAAELTTGALVISQIQKSGRKISMLVANNKGNFSKKATGRITFVCNDGHLIADAIEKTIATGEGQTFWMKSIGTDEKGHQVSEMDFEWSVRLK
jgi:hypothetical protein